jgi:CBS domain-containing protein
MGVNFSLQGGKAMKVRELMTSPAIRIGQDETVEVAARTLAHYNIGALPVCGYDGRVCGLLTDRDLVTRCLASGKNPGQTKVRDVMSGISWRPSRIWMLRWQHT